MARHRLMQDARSFHDTISAFSLSTDAESPRLIIDGDFINSAPRQITRVDDIRIKLQPQLSNRRHTVTHPFKHQTTAPHVVVRMNGVRRAASTPESMDASRSRTEAQVNTVTCRYPASSAIRVFRRRRHHHGILIILNT